MGRALRCNAATRHQHLPQATMQDLRYLLVQIRNATDPMREQEVGCFSRALECEREQITIFNLLAGVPTETDLNAVDAVLIGGSGEYSAAGEAEEGSWLHRTLAGLRLLYELRKPTFASCWGFQALARAMGGRCVHDPAHAELGTVSMHLTPAGRDDPLFCDLENPFLGHAGHEDHVVEIPPGAVLLASSDRVAEQAFKFADAPIYCTQFHPELDRRTYLERVDTYPRYVEKIAGIPADEFRKLIKETPQANRLMKRFAELVVKPA